MEVRKTLRSHTEQTMDTTPNHPEAATLAYASDDVRWHAVQARDAQADGHVVCAVKTIGVYCRPSASTRLPKRENVEFFDTGQAAKAARAGLAGPFPKAWPVDGDETFERLVARVMGFVEAPSLGLNLPRDVQSTAFQQRVRQALREIPPGATASGAQVAGRIGQPKAARAVAHACGANHIAVAAPCRRVVRNPGELSGYRWGVERKRELLRREASWTRQIGS